jgi:hypothetical protein
MQKAIMLGHVFAFVAATAPAMTRSASPIIGQNEFREPSPHQMIASSWIVSVSPPSTSVCSSPSGRSTTSSTTSYFSLRTACAAAKSQSEVMEDGDRSRIICQLPAGTDLNFKIGIPGHFSFDIHELPHSLTVYGSQ